MFSCLKAVIFDMDGVITDTMPYHMLAWRKTFADQGVLVSELDIYLREGQKGFDSIREIFAKKGKVFSHERANKMLADKEILFKKIVRKKYIPGVCTLIRQLLSRKIRLAVVTGTSRDEMERLLPVHFRKKFDVIVTGTDVRRGKPSPEPYLKALRSLRISADAALVIENAPFGILSATRAGICCYGVATSLPSRYLEEASRVFKEHKALSAYLFAKVIR